MDKQVPTKADYLGLATPPADIATPPAALLPSREELHQMRKNSRARLIMWHLLIFVLAPTLLVAGYTGLYATPRYVSVSMLRIEQPQGTSKLGFDGLLSLVGGGHSSLSDIRLVNNYLKSPQILAKLDEWMGIRKIYSSNEIDWFTRLPADASNEDFVEYYQDIIRSRLDVDSGILHVEAVAFTPEDATMISDAVISLSDTLINNIASTAMNDTLELARKEVEKAEKRLSSVRLRLTQFRNINQDIDPVSSAIAIRGVITGLEAELVRLKAELMQLKSYLRHDSIKIVSLETKIHALETQIETERLRLVDADPNSNGTISSRLAEYESLRIEEEFAKVVYTSALAGQQLALADAHQKHKYLVAVAPPTLPQEATEPDCVLFTVSTFLLSLIGYGTIMIIIASIREHLNA